MKILIAHNSYQHQGGEDAVVNAEIDLLRRFGNEVAEYRRHNREIADMSRKSVALSTIWSDESVKQMEALCSDFQPDVIHVHNTFPLISPAIFWLAARRKIPIIQTLHNFRLLCPEAMFLRDGKVCEDCLGKVPWRAATRKCYRDSALQSGVTASMLTFHRAIGTYRNQITAFIALNNFCRDKFIAGGLPAQKIHIKPNFVESTRKPDWLSRKGGVFIGRLSAEKGLDVLVAAMEKLQVRDAESHRAVDLKVAGSGPLESNVAQAFRHNYLGYRAADDVRHLLHSRLYMVAPSTCYETFGLSALEAFSCGLPVIASRHGGLAELISDGKTGLLFTPGDAADLADKIAWAEANPQEMLKMGRAAYAEYLNKYTAEKNYHMLSAIYRDAMPAVKGEPYAA